MVVFSLAVSVKMNILLYAPAVFFVFLLSTRFQSTFWLLFTCAVIQVNLIVNSTSTNYSILCVKESNFSNKNGNFQNDIYRFTVLNFA